MNDTVTSAKVPDAYWSLWGKLKRQHDEDERRLNDAGEISSWQQECVYAEIHAESWRRTPLRLPHRPYKVEFNGVCLIVRGVSKKVHSDAHAVNILRKLDTDDTYLATFLSTATGEPHP